MPSVSLDLDGASAPRGAPPFVGRTTELAWLRGCLDTAVAGRPRIALVVGEPGIGKTRLLRELQEHAASRSIAVCIGRGHEDLAVPFLPIAEALGPEIHALPAAVVRALGPEVDLVRQLVRGDIGTAVHDTQRPWRPVDSRLFLAASRAVIELARTKPLLLMLDDLHWLDQASLELFAHLVASVADLGGHERLHLLVVASTRPLEPAHRLQRVLARFQRDDVCETLDLAGLPEADVTRLVQRLGLRRPTHQMIAVVNDATQGNPLFVQEVLDHLRRHGALRAQGGHLTTTMAASDVPLPIDVTTAIAARVDALDPDGRRLLTLAACCGMRIEPDVLAVIADTSREAVVERLEALAAERLVTPSGASFQFAHPLVRRTLYAAPSPAQRQRLHATIATALRARHLEPTPERDLEIAHHLIAAGPEAEPTMLVAYVRRAGHLAFARAAWTDAARFFEAALARGGPALATRERAELHRLAGLSHYRDQDAGPCLEQYELAIRAFTEIDDPRGLARALMGYTRACFTLASVSYGTLIDPAPLVKVAERLAELDPVLCGFVWSEIAQVYWTARNPVQARAFGERALTTAAAEHDDLLAAEAHRALALVASQELDPSGSLEHLQAGLAAARRANDDWLESQLVQRLSLPLFWRGRLDEMARVIADADVLSQRLHDWGDHSLTAGARVCLAVARGDFDAAERHAQTTMALLERSSYPWAGPTALPALACARWYRGAWSEAEDALEILAEPGQVFEEPGPALQFLLFVLRQTVRAWTEDPEALRAEYNERIAPLARSIGVEEASDVYGLGICAAVVDIAERVTSPAMAASVLPLLTRAAERGVVLTSGWTCLVARALGTAATLTHDWDAAERWFARAVEQATALDLGPELARAHLGWARVLVARGRATDRRAGARHLALAMPLLQRFGMRGFLADARMLADSVHAGAPASAGPAAGAGAVSTRELSILRHLARGHDDRTIARDLVLRPATLTRHLRALCRKIGAATRADAVAYAQANGLAPDLGPPRDPGMLAILFTDIVGSTAILERLGDRDGRALLRIHDDIVREALARTDGTETKHTGDGIMATFPSVALAIACAIAIQRGIAAHNAHHPERRLGVRIGVNAGEPVSERGDVFGTTVTAAARICGHARAGQILVAEVVRHLAAGQDVRLIDRGRTKLRGFTKAVRLFELPW